MPCVFAMCFVLVVSLLKMAPKHSAEVLSRVSKVKEGCDVLYGEDMCV